MQTEYDLNALKVKRRGPLPSLQSSADKAKIRVTIALDADIVSHFQSIATQPGGLPYQTQINQALREVITQPANTESIKEALLHDRAFIREVARQLP